MRSIFRITFLLLLASVSIAKAEESEKNSSIGGRVYTDQFFSVSDAQSHEMLQSSFSAWLEYQQKLIPKFSLHLVGQGDFFIRSILNPTQSSSDGRMREAYLAYQNDSFDIRLGQQIIPWGKSDIVNPTDYFSAKDYTLLNSDEEVRRKGSPALLVSVSPDQGTSPFNFTGVMQFVYPQNTLFIPPNVQLYPGLILQKYPNSPDWFTPKNMEYGLKFSYLKNNFDFSLSAFRGMNHFAQYVYRQAITSVTPENFQQTAAGADASLTTGSLVIRAESAVTVPDQGNQGSALYGLVEPTHWDTTAGVEHTFFDDFQTQVQVLYRHHFNYVDPNHYTNINPIIAAIQHGVGSANALLLNYQHEDNIGATFRVGYQNDASKWKADLFLVGYFSQGQDLVVRPQVSYKVLEGWRVLAGGDFYGGDSSRPFGAMKVNNALFMESIYTF